MQRLLLNSLLAVSLALTVPPAAARAAQATTGNEAATQSQAAAPADAAAETPGMAARAIVRIAISDLKLVTTPAERDYRIAAELIEVAHELDPSDHDILRLLIQAWTSAGDADRADALNRELFLLDPRDTVTQLAVVSSRVSRLQDADARLAAYEKFLGPEGQAFDPAIRSRLAMDAALLKRERGDDEGFARTLATACQLDPTNKDAATLALAYFADRVPDAAGRFELLANVLKSDPFDPEVHAAMAEELAAAGATRAAERFYTTLGQLRRVRGEQMTPQESAEAIVSNWNVEGAAALVRRLTDEVENSRSELRTRRERIAAAGGVLAQVNDPSEIRLSIPFERTRVVASAALGDPELIGYAVEEAAESIRRTLETINSPDTRPEGMTDEEVINTTRSLKTERIWLRLWSGRTTEQAAAELAELRDADQLDRPTLARLEACLRLRQGELDRARNELVELANDDPLASMALGILAEVQGDTAQAVKTYTDLSRSLGGSIAGSFCRTRVIKLAGSPPEPTELARKLQTLADAIPQSVEAMIGDPRRFMDVRVEVIGSETRLLSKIQTRFSIENTSKFPLALGPDKPINSRFLMAPIVDIGIQRLAVPGLQEVVWLNRRLRLMPGERFETTVWVDSGVLGAVLQRLSSTTARIRWRVVQGFKLNREGFYEVGPLCLSMETGTIVRGASGRTNADIATLAGWIERGTPREMAESVLALIEKISMPAADAPKITEQDVEAIAAAVVARFRGASRSEKLLLLALSPSTFQLPPFALLDAEAMKETDEGMLKYFLGTRVPSADSPQIAPDAWVSRPSVQAFANIVRERLADGERTIATVGKGGEEPKEQTPARPDVAPDNPAPAPAGQGGGSGAGGGSPRGG